MSLPFKYLLAVAQIAFPTDEKGKTRARVPTNGRHAFYLNTDAKFSHATQFINVES